MLVWIFLATNLLSGLWTPFSHSKQVQNVKPVKLTVFYESLCPDSRRFLVNQLKPTYSQLKNITEIKLYAYGKAFDISRENGEGFTFQCQHGPRECYGNKVLECGKKYIENQESYLHFTFCVMNTYRSSGYSHCATSLGLPYENIETCSNNVEGEILLHEAGAVQNRLNPPVNYVPWIIVNDNYTYQLHKEAEYNLKTLVCQKYEGEVPSVCKS